MTKPHLTPSPVDALINQARTLPRRRLHLNLHAVICSPETGSLDVRVFC